MNSNLKKRISRYSKFLIAFILVLFLVITFPFITGFVYIITLIFGQPVSYIAGGIVSNFYIPLLLILIVMCLWTVYHIIIFNMFINGVTVFPIIKPFLKNILILIIIVISTFVFAFNSVQNISNLILDIHNLETSDFAQMDGTLTLYEINESTFLKIDGVKFEGGFAHGEEFVEGEKYHVEYLPHSKYVIKYHRYSS